MWYIWLIIAGIFFIAEILTVGFMLFWLGIAAVITCIISLFTSNLIIQTTIFVILSTILLIFTKPLVDKFAGNKGPAPKTNAFSIIGKEATVTKQFNEYSKIGQIKVGAEKWTAKSEAEETLSPGDKVIVESIDGVKAIVTKI